MLFTTCSPAESAHHPEPCHALATVVSTVVSTVAFTTPEGNQCVLQPDSFSGEGLPASGLVAGDGRFTLTSSRAGAFGNCWGGTVSGAVPAPVATGAVPSGVAVVAWSYQDILGDRVITGEQDVPPDF